MSKQTQIALDFGQEPVPPPPPAENADGAEAPVRSYMAAGGVGVRIKSYKQTPPPSQSGDLFGNIPPEAAPPETAGPAVPEVVAAIAEEPTARRDEPVVMAVEPTATAAISEVPAMIPETGPSEPAIVPAPKRIPAAKRPTAKQGPSKRGRKSLKQVAAEADLIEIPTDEVLFSKQYYTMGEVSEMFRVNQSLLRFWETEFDILQPKKNKKGDRYFRPVDIKNLHLIYHLLRQKKYTIEGAKDFLKKNSKAEERFEVIQRLQQIKAFLQEMKAQL